MCCTRSMRQRKVSPRAGGKRLEKAGLGPGPSPTGKALKAELRQQYSYQRGRNRSPRWIAKNLSRGKLRLDDKEP